ncbi:MAG: putative bifunctional diguanylate cyclase/phosphodiesterase [Paracoccaceae bacterium]
MQVDKGFKTAKAVITSPAFFFFATAFITWPILAEVEAFEAFFDFTRAHEDWDVDELVMLGVNLTIALLLSVLQKTYQLRRLIHVAEGERARADRNASHDALTGLNNRRAFTQIMNNMRARLDDQTHVCLAMIDLDRFKPVNDLRGHAVGDAVLSAVADRLREAVGLDARVARLGGDEFAVLFDPEASVATVERAARRIVHMMEQSFHIGPAGISISCSVGLVVWSKDLSVAEVMRRADAALYKAKADGRARFSWYDSELDRQSAERLALEFDLKDAIESEQVQAWFQPIVELETQKLVGFEVLARWDHPTLGMVSPETFVDIAEDCGLIDMLGLSVLRQACDAAQSWPGHLAVSVNVSPVQFSSAGFLGQIKEALRDSQFDPSRLIIEVTESSVMKDLAAAREKLIALKATGISVALDDFGTGYSSLSSLRQLPFDRVKIDRSFVTSIETQPTNQKIVQIIIDLARALELDVTIEGIETFQELSYLNHEAHGHGQGYLFERPLPRNTVQWRIETDWSDGVVAPCADAAPPDAAMTHRSA